MGHTGAVIYVRFQECDWILEVQKYVMNIVYIIGKIGLRFALLGLGWRLNFIIDGIHHGSDLALLCHNAIHVLLQLGHRLAREDHWWSLPSNGWRGMGIGIGHMTLGIMTLNCPHLLPQNLWIGFLLWNGNMSRGKPLHIIFAHLLILSGQESQGYLYMFYRGEMGWRWCAMDW